MSEGAIGRSLLHRSLDEAQDDDGGIFRPLEGALFKTVILLLYCAFNIYPSGMLVGKDIALDLSLTKLPSVPEIS